MNFAVKLRVFGLENELKFVLNEALREVLVGWPKSPIEEFEVGDFICLVEGLDGFVNLAKNSSISELDESSSYL